MSWQKCLDTRNITFFFRVVFSSSCLLTHSTPFSSSTKNRSIISVWLWLWYSTIQHRSNFFLNFEVRKTSIKSWYVYSKNLSSIGSLPWFRAKIVEEFTRAVSSIYTNITNVHFLLFSSCEVPCAGQQYLYHLLWNHTVYTIPICGNHHILWYPVLAQELTTWGHSFFSLMTSQHTMTTIKSNLFVNKSRWTMVAFALHPLFQ